MLPDSLGDGRALLLGEVVDLDGIDHAMDLLDRTAETDAVRAVLKHG